MMHYRILYLKPMEALGRLEMTEIKVNKFEDRTKEISQYEKHRKRMCKASGTY